MKNDSIPTRQAVKNKASGIDPMAMVKLWEPLLMVSGKFRGMVPVPKIREAILLPIYTREKRATPTNARTMEVPFVNETPLKYIKKAAGVKGTRRVMLFAITDNPSSNPSINAARLPKLTPKINAIPAAIAMVSIK